MKATLHTQNFRVHDFELVRGFAVRQGTTFTIKLDLEQQDPSYPELFTSNDPVLAVDIQEGGSALVVVAGVEGISKMRLYDASNTLVKEWVIEVYTEEAARINITGAEIEFR